MQPPEQLDFYDILRIQQTANLKDIARAYRKLAVLLHPDKNPSPDAHERFCQLNDAHETLKDTTKRCDYDRKYPAIKLKWAAYRTWQEQQQKPKQEQSNESGSTGFGWNGQKSGSNWPPPPKAKPDDEPDFGIWSEWEKNRRTKQTNLAEEAFYSKINALRRRMTPLKDEISRLQKLMKEDEDNPMPSEPTMLAYGTWLEALRGTPSAAYQKAKKEWDELKRQRDTRKNIRESLIEKAEKDLAPLEQEADILRSARAARKAKEEEDEREQEQFEQRRRTWKAQKEAAEKTRKEREAREKEERLREEREKLTREARRKAAEEAERLRKEKLEAERKAKEKADRLWRERMEAQRKAWEEAERLRREREEEERVRQARQRAEQARKRREAEEAERARQERIREEQARKKREAEDLAAWERVEAKKEEIRRSELLKEQIHGRRGMRGKTSTSTSGKSNETADASLFQKMLTEQAEKYEAMLKSLKEDLGKELEQERAARLKAESRTTDTASQQGSFTKTPPPTISPKTRQPLRRPPESNAKPKESSNSFGAEQDRVPQQNSKAKSTNANAKKNRSSPFSNHPAASGRSDNVNSKSACKFHQGFWPKVSESSECPHCERLFPDWILECRGCKMRSCTRCLKAAKALGKSE